MTAVRVGCETDNLGPTRAVSPATVEWVKHLRDQGASPSVIARVVGVNVRTVYRYLDDDRVAETFRLGSWEAEFSVGDDRQPQRLTPWRRTDGR